MAVEKLLTTSVQKGMQAFARSTPEIPVAAGQAAKACENLSSQVPKLTRSEAGKAKKLINKISTVVDQRLSEAFIGKYSSPISEYAQQTRDLFVKTMENANVSQKTLKGIKKAKTWGELQSAIYNFDSAFNQYEIKPILDKIPERRSGMPLEIEQMYYEKNNLRGDCVRYLHALFAKPSTNSEVALTERILKESYGVDTALLNNDTEQAKRVLAAVLQAKRNGIEIPKEFIVSNYKLGGEHLRIFSGQESSVVLGSSALSAFKSKYVQPVKCSQQEEDLLSRWFKSTGFENWYSTNHPEHAAMHEILHKQHLQLLSFKFKRIPKRFAQTINNLSGYAAAKPNCAHEVYTELNTKRVLEGLKPDEEELFKFLGGKL